MQAIAINNTLYWQGKWGTIFIDTNHGRVRITRRGKNHKGKYVAKQWVSLILKPNGRIRP